MSKEKKTPNTKPEEDNQGKSELIKQIPAIISAIAGLLTALAGAVALLHQAGLISSSSTSTPTPSFTPSPTWTATLVPINTPSPSAMAALNETLTPTPTVAEPSPPPTTASPGCPWLPHSTLNPAITVGENCLNDLLGLGISETDQIVFYREKGMNIGIFGISKKIASANELSIDITIKELKAVRFLTLISQQKQGYQSSIGFRIVREGQKKLIQLVRYDANGYDTVASETTELDMWAGKLKLTLQFNGPQVRAYVNNAFFGQTQIEFTERYLFLGYQVMSGGGNNPYIHLFVKSP